MNVELREFLEARGIKFKDTVEPYQRFLPELYKHDYESSRFRIVLVWGREPGETWHRVGDWPDGLQPEVWQWKYITKPIFDDYQLAFSVIHWPES